MKTEINNEIVKEYGMDAGASVVGIATSKDFALAPRVLNQLMQWRDVNL